MNTQNALGNDHQNRTLYEQFTKTEEILEKRGEKPELPITTIPSLDKKLWGLKRREMMVIGARTSIGKTAFALQLAWDMAVNNKKVWFISLEMHTPALMERLFCNIYKINNEDLLHGKFPKYLQEWLKFKNLLDSKFLVFDDAIGKTWGEVDNFVKQLMTKPDVVFIDHVNHVKSSGENNKKVIDDYIRHFREMAIRHNFAGVLCAQINRFAQNETKSRIPELHHLKGCVSEDSVVNGYKIKDFVLKKFNFPVKSYNDMVKEIEPIIPSQYINSGIKDCLKIKTKSGKEIIVSKCTKLFDGKKWVKSENLKLKNKILVEY